MPSSVRRHAVSVRRPSRSGSVRPRLSVAITYALNRCSTPSLLTISVDGLTPSRIAAAAYVNADSRSLSPAARAFCATLSSSAASATSWGAITAVGSVDASPHATRLAINTGALAHINRLTLKKEVVVRIAVIPRRKVLGSRLDGRMPPAWATGASAGVTRAGRRTLTRRDQAPAHGALAHIETVTQSAFVYIESRSEGLERPAHLRLDGLDRESQHLRDLGVRHVLLATEQEDLAAS